MKDHTPHFEVLTIGENTPFLVGRIPD